MTLEDVKAYRARSYRTLSERRMNALEEAIDFVDERGFIHLWPIKGVILPSLWAAVAGDRPVPSNHDDPGHVTWGWKDRLLGKRAWYYAKVLRKKATLISFEVLPHFYALSKNYGDYKEDYLELYRDGLLSPEAKAVYEALLEEGPLHSLALRREARIDSRAAFARALEALQSDFKVLPVGVAKAGRWRYAFIYELAGRHYPELPDRTRGIPEDEARIMLLKRYFHSVGAARQRDVAKLFGWPMSDIEAAVLKLCEQGIVLQDVWLEGESYAVLAELMV